MKIKFIAKQCSFQGMSGYQFEQYDDIGHLVCSQFIDGDTFESYLKEANINREDVSIERVKEDIDMCDMYDISRLCRKLTREGMTIEQIIDYIAENATMMVNEEFIKHWAEGVGISAPSDFCVFLLMHHYFEDIVKSYEEVICLQRDIENGNAEISGGNPIDRDGNIFSWKDYCDSKGIQRYQTKEDWISFVRQVIADNEKSVAMEKESIKEKWEEYAGSSDANELLESEMAYIMDWWNEYENMVSK